VFDVPYMRVSPENYVKNVNIQYINQKANRCKKW
jgi:hypothetical protein